MIDGQPHTVTDYETLTWDVHPEREAVRVSPAGSLDLATAPMLRAQLDELREAGFQNLILDLRRLDFLDSSGLRLMLVLHGEARRDGFSFAVVNAPAAVRRVFELTGTNAVLASDGG